jgi:hypothetical protein
MARRMSNPRDQSSQESPDPGADPTTADGKRSGRIAYDERGNSVWEWQLETGVYSRDISTQRLKKLDLNDLSIADTAKHPRPPGLTDPAGRKAPPGGGFNPYDNFTTRGGKVASDPYNSASRGALKPAAPARKPVDLKKLEEWHELRKRVEHNKREDGDD